MKNTTLASIDIGTNTFRLLIAEVEDYSINSIHSERVIVRLGEGISHKKIISQDAINRGISTLKRFSEIISKHNVKGFMAVATSALREAVNSEEFLKRAKDETGIDIQIISGEEEARLTALGMLIDIDVTDPALLIDIGGGSTELILTNKMIPVRIESRPIGVVYLAEKYMQHDPPLERDLKSMAGEIEKGLRELHPLFASDINDNTILVGTAGTITTLSAVNQGLKSFDHSLIHKSRMNITHIREIYKKISIMTTSQRAEYIPYEPERLDIIVPGTLILLMFMDIFNFTEITVSDYGLREGILIDLYRKIEDQKGKNR